jgi:hypothetical protein
MKVISQREARRLRKQVNALTEVIQSQRRRYSYEFAGVEIHSEDMTVEGAAAFLVARKLGHAVVVSSINGTVAKFTAMPLPSEPVP